MNLIDMVHSRAPAALNSYASEGEFPLFVATFYGHNTVVSKLLPLGAMQRIPRNSMCRLLVAVDKGFILVGRALINGGGG